MKTKLLKQLKQEAIKNFFTVSSGYFTLPATRIKGYTFRSNWITLAFDRDKKISEFIKLSILEYIRILRGKSVCNKECIII